MGLKIWNLSSDLFDYTQLESNLAILDTHNHTGGQGVQIPTTGIASGAVTTAQIASSTILGSNIAATAGVFAASTPVVSAASALSASPGQFVILSGISQTLSLPAPLAGTVVAVACTGASLTGSNANTLSSSLNGGHINGLGVNALSSFNLGALGANCVLMADGTNWEVIAGQADTGWTALTIPTGWLQDGDKLIAARYVGDRVWFRGAITNLSGGSSSLSLPLPTAGVWAGATVSNTVYLPAVGNVSPPINLIVNAPATLALNSPIPNNAILSLEGLSYGTPA